MSIPKYESKCGPLDVSSPLDLARLSKKSVVITGGGSGLGKAYAKAFSAAGAFVTIGDVDKDSGSKVAEEISASGKGGAQFVKCDVRSWDEQVLMFEAAVKGSPNNSCDIVIANAGIAGRDELSILEDPTLQPWKPDLRTLDINLVGLVYTTKLALHFFRRQRLSSDHDRCLILKASLAGFLDLPGSPLYNVSKFGVRAVMRNLRWTSWKESIRVNLVAPWFIQTPIMTESLVTHLESRGTESALEEDSVKAMMRIASDANLNGRSLGVIPRSWDSKGFLDLDHDDFKDGDLLKDWQMHVLHASH